MKGMIRLLCAENRRAWKIFPKMLLQAIVLALMAGTIAFCATKILYKDNGIEIKAAVVNEEENPLTEFAMDYIKQAEDGVEFVECNKEQAMEGLKKNEFTAVIILPEQLIEGILSGENASAVVIYNENLSIAGGFFKELTQAGVSMLSVAQAEIYAIYELAGEVGAESGLQNFQDSINIENLNLAMGRSSLFLEKEVSATGSYSLPVYYAASGIVAIMLFFGIPMGMFLKQDKKVLLVQYGRAGIGAGKQQVNRWITVMGIYGAVALMIGIAAILMGKNDLYKGLSFIAVIWFISGSMAAFILLIYEMTEKKSSAILLTTFLVVTLLFLSGGIIPKVFFSESLRNVAEYLPSTFWLEGVAGALEGSAGMQEICGSLLYGLLFFVGAVFLRRKRVVL